MASTDVDAHTPRHAGSAGLTVAVLASSALAFAAAQTMVAPALPWIGHDLHVSTTTVSWVLTGFLISAAIAPPVLGRLGDMYGKQRLLVATLSVFAVGSLVCALVQSIGPLIAGRVVMGAGGAIFPLAFGIVRDELPAERVSGAIGVIAATFGVGGAVGTVMSGVVVDGLGYRALFWIVLAVALLALVVVWRFVPASPVTSPGRVDWLGALVLGGWLVALLVAVSEGQRWGWSSRSTVGLLAGAALLAGLWVVLQRRTSDPLIDIGLLRHRPLVVTNVNSLLIGFAMFATFIALPRLVQAPTITGYGFGSSVTAAGLFLTPAALAMLIGGPGAGLLAARRSSRFALAAGAALVALGLAMLAAAHSDRAWIYIATFVFGIGIGLAVAAQGSITIAVVEQHQTGAAGGANTVVRTVGGALGAQVAASILAGHQLQTLPFPTDGAFTTVFAACGVTAVIAGLVAMALPSRIPGRRLGSIGSQAATTKPKAPR